MDFENKIKELKIKLPEAKPPVGSYVATKIIGNLLYISGQISISENGELIKGKVGKDLSVDEGYKAAERCGLSIISQAKVACHGDLSKVKWLWYEQDSQEYKINHWGQTFPGSQFHVYEWIASTLLPSEYIDCIPLHADDTNYTVKQVYNSVS